MKKLSNTEAELKKGVAYKKNRVEKEQQDDVIDEKIMAG